MGKYSGSAIDYASVLEAIPQPIAVCDMEGSVLFLNATGRLFLKMKEGAPLPRFALSRRATFSQVRIEDRGPFREYFLADVEISGAGRQRASMSLSALGEDYYRVILEAAPRAMVAPILDELDAMVAICDGRRKVRLSNAALNQLLNHLDGEASDRDILELFCDEDRPALRVAASQALAGTVPDEISARVTQGLPEGCETVRVRIRPLHRGDEGGVEAGHRGFLLVAQPAQQSFSELRRRFARAEELMSLGELATGVAHELKNPLTSILNYADYLMKKYRGQFIEQRDGERLQRIIDGVERIDRFVRDLLHLAGAESFEFDDVDVHASIRSAVQLSREALDEREVEVLWALAAEVSTIPGHDGALQQVFTNLLLNAARAMPEGGGTVTIRSRLVDDTLEIAVEDTARGMSEQTRQRIFDPFYSTSTDGEGAGLGLALVRRIVEQHNGQIRVESTLGQGSCFTLILPT